MAEGAYADGRAVLNIEYECCRRDPGVLSRAGDEALSKIHRGPQGGADEGTHDGCLAVLLR
jgi:hypothetical protein